MDHDTQAEPVRIKTPPPAGPYHFIPHPASPKSLASEPPMNTYHFHHAASTPSIDQFPSRRAISISGDISPNYGTETFAESSLRSPAPLQTSSPHLMPRGSFATPSSHDTFCEPEKEAYVRQRRYSDGHILFERAVQPLTGSSWVSSGGSRRDPASLRLHPYVSGFFTLHAVLCLTSPFYS